MREGIRNLVKGLVLAFGVVWLLLTFLLLGSLVLQASDARNLSETGASIGDTTGGAVWASGAVLVATYALAVIRGRYLIALVSAVVPLVGTWVASQGPFVASQRSGPVLALGVAVGLAAALVLAAGGASWALWEQRHPERSRRHASQAHRIPPLRA